MTENELMEHKLYCTEHLKSCRIYGDNPEEDGSCDCPKISKTKYIKRLEMKIELMRYFVPTEKEMEITNKVVKAC